MPVQRAKNWFYTLNNFTEDESINCFRLPPSATFHVVGREVGTNGTPHLQGTIGYSERRSMAQVKSDLSPRCHLEPTRKVQKSIKYCRKEGDSQSFGDVPSGATVGARTDLEGFKESVKEGQYDVRVLRDMHSEVLAKYPRFCLEFIRDHRPLREVEDHPLRPWQQTLSDLLELAPDSRTILFVVDIEGDSGKSWFADYYHYHHQSSVQVLNPSKKNDMAYALDETKSIFFFDAPRSKQGDFIQYDILEELKNGRVFSPKYESGMKYFPKCHVIVLMNEIPDMEKLSSDRYHIINP